MFVRKALFIIAETTNIMKINICMFFSVKSLKVGNTCRIYIICILKPSGPPTSIVPKPSFLETEGFLWICLLYHLHNVFYVMKTEPKGEKLWLKYVKLILKHGIKYAGIIICKTNVSMDKACVRTIKIICTFKYTRDAFYIYALYTIIFVAIKFLTNISCVLKLKSTGAIKMILGKCGCLMCFMWQLIIHELCN